MKKLLVMGSVLVGAVPAGQATEDNVYGAWKTHCEAAQGSDTARCQIQQMVKSKKEQDKTLMGVIVANRAEHPMPHILMRFTAAADQAKGAAVKVDKHDFMRVPIADCDEQVCEVRSFIPDSLLNQMERGKVMWFAYYIGDQQITYSVSLNGFDQAFATLL